MPTNKQTDYFAKYKNVEVISGPKALFGYVRLTGQLKNGRWAVWQSTFGWGGNFTRPERLPYGERIDFATKEEAIAFSERIK